jgi:hypothetical protein
MGLDLEPMGRSVAGQEAEWERLMEILYKGGDAPPDHAKRLLAISIPPYADIGAPRVGFDAEADAWMIARARQAGETKADDEIIAATKGYYVVDLLLGKSDGVPAYSNSGLYDVGATSFRGQFLEDCTAFLDTPTIELAWRDFTRPSEAVAYGQRLIAALNRPVGPSSGRATDNLSVQEQRQVIDIAGRWYVFWGNRGNPIWANF